MAQFKKLDFSGTTIFCGIDVHKKSWRVNIQDSEFELEDFSQNADTVLLYKHLNRKYPGLVQLMQRFLIIEGNKVAGTYNNISTKVKKLTIQ
jgi:hypothetical protein